MWWAYMIVYCRSMFHVNLPSVVIEGTNLKISIVS